MNIHELREAQVHFESQIDCVIKAKTSLYDSRDKFANYYTVKRIKSIPFDEYANGKN